MTRPAQFAQAEQTDEELSELGRALKEALMDKPVKFPIQTIVLNVVANGFTIAVTTKPLPPPLQETGNYWDVGQNLTFIADDPDEAAGLILNAIVDGIAIP